MNRNAYGIGRIVDGCGLDAEKVKEVLIDAAIDAGYSPSKALECINRAVDAGMANPREVAPDSTPPAALAPTKLALGKLARPVERRLLSGHEFAARSYPPRKLVVGPLCEKSLTLVYGATNSAKSWLTLAMMLDAAAAGVTTVTFQEDAEEEALHERFRRVGIPPGSYHIALPMDLKLSSDGDLAWMVAEIQRLGAKLVILDVLSDFLSGDEENDQAETRRLVTRLRYLVRETGAAVVCVHHSNKASEGKPGEHWQSSFANMRGNTILPGACNFLIEVRLRPKKVEEYGNGDFVSDVFVPKTKDGKRQPPGWLNFTEAADGTIQLKWVWGPEAIAKRAVDRSQDEAIGEQLRRFAREWLLRQLEHAPNTQTQLTEDLPRADRKTREMKGFQAEAKRQFSLLIAEGLIVAVELGKRGTGWRLTDAGRRAIGNDGGDN